MGEKGNAPWCSRVLAYTGQDGSTRTTTCMATMRRVVLRVGAKGSPVAAGWLCRTCGTFVPEKGIVRGPRRGYRWATPEEEAEHRAWWAAHSRQVSEELRARYGGADYGPNEDAFRR